MSDILDLAAQDKIKRLFLTRNKADFAGAICHITQHSCGSEPLFVEDKDYLYFLSLVKDRSNKFEMDMLAFCLMPNHLHILLKVNKANLRDAMQSLFLAYARYFNKKYERKGHVFCGSFRQAVCLDEVYVLAASAYIHLNPISAGLVSDYKLYRWSSCNLYIADIDRQTFINFAYILQLLDAEMTKARSIYRALLDKMQSVKIKPIREKRHILDDIKAKMLKSLNIIAREGGTVNLSKGILSSAEIESQIEGLKQGQRFRTPGDIKARKFLIEQLRARGYKINEIALKLGLSRKTISKIVNVTE